MKRLFGFLLVLFAAASLLGSGYVLLQTWQLRQPITNDLLSGLGLISDTVKTTSDSLNMAKSALTTLSDNLSVVQSTSALLAVSIADASKTVGQISEVTGADIRQVISDTQTTLVSAQASAAVIESVLTAVTQIPFFPGGPYQPETPLSEALGQTAASLSRIGPSLQSIRVELEITEANIKSFENQIYVFNESIRQAQQDLLDAQKVVDETLILVAAIQSRLGELEKRLPLWVDGLVWGLTFILVWLMIIQADFLWRGLKMVVHPVASPKPAAS